MRMISSGRNGPCGQSADVLIRLAIGPSDKRTKPQSRSWKHRHDNACRAGRGRRWPHGARGGDGGGGDGGPHP